MRTGKKPAWWPAGRGQMLEVSSVAGDPPQMGCSPQHRPSSTRSEVPTLTPSGRKHPQAAFTPETSLSQCHKHIKDMIRNVKEKTRGGEAGKAFGRLSWSFTGDADLRVGVLVI